jgi:hypothetical protein
MGMVGDISTRLEEVAEARIAWKEIVTTTAA